MISRLFSRPVVRLLGLSLLCCTAGLARGDFARAYEAAVLEQDWTTAAEIAIRWVGEAPTESAVYGKIARARLLEGDRVAAETWLERWEATAPEPSASMLALRGELARSLGDSKAARGYWLRSYALAPDADVARRLLDQDYWGRDERKLYETWMARVAADFEFVAALQVTAEAAVRARDWPAVERIVAFLNESGTRPAMSAAAVIELPLKERETLRAHDAAVGDGDSGLALARRAHWFLTRDLYDLAFEDATESLARAPRMVLPKITLAVCHRHWRDRETVRALEVITQDDSAAISDAVRAVLDRLDHAVSQPVVAPRAFLDRALALAACGQYYLASNDLVAAGPALTDSADGWACQGACFRAQRRTAEAKNAFETALKKEAGHRRAWVSLAELAMERADYSEAKKRYQWLAERDPKNKEFAERLAQATARLR